MFYGAEVLWGDDGFETELVDLVKISMWIMICSKVVRDRRQ